MRDTIKAIVYWAKQGSTKRVVRLMKYLVCFCFGHQLPGGTFDYEAPFVGCPRCRRPVDLREKKP